MSTPPPTDRSALARERLAARGRRFSLLRRRAVAATLATFALAWGVIAFAGPMGQTTKATTTASTSTVATSAKATATATATPDTAPVTTAQS